MDAATTAALIAESAKRSGLLWVRRIGPGPDAGAAARPVWHVWHDGSAYLLTGGIEQPMPEGLDVAGTHAEVTVRSKDKGSRLAVWHATVQVIEPGSAEWGAVLPALVSTRLNSPDGEQAPHRWARECRLLRLVPFDG